MAGNGNFSTSAYNLSDGNRYLTFAWSIQTQNIAANTTTIYWEVKGAGSSRQWVNARNIKVTIAGTVVYYQGVGSASNYINLENGTRVASGMHTITHKTDGTQSFTAAVEAGIYVWAVNCTGSQTFTLDTIPRATTPTVGVSVRDMGDYVTIYTNRASDAFTHDLAYSFMGSAYQTIATGVATWHNWTIPDLASQIPNTTSGTATIRCITKNGSTVIGTKTVTMTLKVPASVVPTISAVAATEATDGLAAQFGAFIQGKSALNVKITAAGARGSTISSYKATLAGLAYTGATFTTHVLTTAGTFDLVATVTDSRGRTASKTMSIPVLAYTTPVISALKVYRVNDRGDASPDGVYVMVNQSYSVPTLNGGNRASVVLEYKTATSGSWATLWTSTVLQGAAPFVPDVEFSTDYQYDIRLTVTDWFGASTSYTVVVPSADVVLDISSDGKGLGIGKVAQRSNATEFARVMYDRFDTVIGNGLAQYGSGDNAIDPDTTLEHLVLTNVNTPASGFWYIQTLFYSTKSKTANRVQLALPYQNDGSIWVRRYYSGAWSEWMGSPTLMREYDYGIWHVRYWSDGWLEMTGSLEITDMPCTTALGTWYRTAVFDSGTFPAPMDRPVVTANYESDGYGALLWATTEATNAKGPSYYLIRPTSTTIASGRVQLRVTGRAV